MPRRLADIIRQKTDFASLEEECVLALQVAASRLLEPWMAHLKAEAGLTPNQYNVLRILRGARPDGLPCGDIAERMITRDPDITRLVDRLGRSGLVQRERGTADRRVIRVSITGQGLDVLDGLDAAANELPVQLLGGLGEEKLVALRQLLEETIELAGTHRSRASARLPSIQQSGGCSDGQNQGCDSDQWSHGTAGRLDGQRAPEAGLSRSRHDAQAGE
ncbi:MAG TPA: MarR family transcriptional regulator [Candidatus Krumholzibacteria bacterium]